MRGHEDERRRRRAGALAAMVAAAALLPACAPGSVSVGVGVAAPAPWGGVTVSTAVPYGPPGAYGPLYW